MAVLWQYTAMTLKKTSVQLDEAVCDKVRTLYPELTISEIVRMALEYVAATSPIIQTARTAAFQPRMETGQ